MSVPCPDCDETFPTDNGMKTHYGHKHEKPYPWRLSVCPVCKDEFSSGDSNNTTYCGKSCANRARGPDSGTVPFYLEYGSVGHPTWRDSDITVAVHQLVAVANGEDPEEVFGRNEWNVDHKNGCSLDNRHDNIQVMHVSEHGRKDGGGGSSYGHKDILRVVDFFLHPYRYADEDVSA